MHFVGLWAMAASCCWYRTFRALAYLSRSIHRELYATCLAQYVRCKSMSSAAAFHLTQVRRVLGPLWAAYPTAEAMADADPGRLSELLRPLGLYRRWGASERASFRPIGLDVSHVVRQGLREQFLTVSPQMHTPPGAPSPCGASAKSS